MFMLMTKIINILAYNPFEAAAVKILLWLDKTVYSFVARVYTIFMSICQINLSVLAEMMEGLINRAKALIVVFVVFKLALALISNFTKPDEAAKASKKILINVLIAAALLTTYGFVFDVMNELNMMLIGKPESYHYKKLSAIAGATDEADDGLVMRFFFGSNGNVIAKDADGIGQNIAINSLCATFPDTDKNTCNTLKSKLSSGGKVDVKKLSNIFPYLEKEVDGHVFIALFLGLYIIYAVGKAAIEVGVRMFKLLVLQLVAPLAIVSIISEKGLKSEVFSKYVKTYMHVLLSAFIRIAAILMVTVFVSKFFANMDTMFSSVNSGGLNGLLTTIVVIVAGYQFAGQLPKFLGEIFKSAIGDIGDMDAKGFGNFLTQLATVPIAAGGLVGGVALGAASSARQGNGVGGAVLGGLTGGVTGAAASLRGDTIAEKIRNVHTANTEGTRARANKMADMGGAGAYMGGAALSHMPFWGKNAQDQKVASMDRAIAKQDKELEKYKSLTDIASAYDEYQKSQIANEKIDVANDLAGINARYDADIKNVKFGDDDKSFVEEMLKHDMDYMQKKAQFDAAQQSGTVTDAQIADYNETLTAAKDRAKAIYAKKQKSIRDENTASIAAEFAKQAKELNYNGDLDNKSLKDIKGELEPGRQTVLTNKRNLEREKKDYTDKARYKNVHNYTKSGDK